MEDDRNERQLQVMKTSIEDDHNGRKISCSKLGDMARKWIQHYCQAQPKLSLADFNPPPPILPSPLPISRSLHLKINKFFT